MPNGRQLEGDRNQTLSRVPLAMVRKGSGSGPGTRGWASWHPSPGKNMGRKGLCVLGGCKHRPAGSSESPWEKWGGLQAPSLPPHLTPAPETETHRKGSAPRHVVLVPKTTGHGQ